MLSVTLLCLTLSLVSLQSYITYDIFDDIMTSFVWHFPWLIHYDMIYQDQFCVDFLRSFFLSPEALLENFLLTFSSQLRFSDIFLCDAFLNLFSINMHFFSSNFSCRMTNYLDGSSVLALSGRYSTQIYRKSLCILSQPHGTERREGKRRIPEEDRVFLVCLR